MVFFLLHAGCSPSPQEQLIDKAVVQLEAAEQLLKDAKLDSTALGLAVMHYRADHRAELMALRKEANTLLREATEPQRIEMAKRSQEQTAVIMGRIFKATKRFPKPKRAQQIIQPLIMQTTPAPSKHDRKVKRPWMPPVPPLPTDPSGAAKHPHPSQAPAQGPSRRQTLPSSTTHTGH